MIRGVTLTIFLLAAFLTVTGCSARKGKHTSVVVVFQTEGQHGVGTISAYSQESGLRCIARCKGLFNTPLFGYHALSDTWVMDTSSDSTYGPGYIVELHKGKMSVIRLAGFPEEGLLQDMPLTEGALIVSSVVNGCVELIYYDLRGSVKSTRILKVPNRVIVDCIGQVTVTRAGFIAASLLMEDTMQSELCIFDSSGGLKERIGKGGDPEYAPGGHRLAYKDYLVKRDNMGGQRAYGDEGTIIIYDLRTKAKKKIAVQTPPGLARINMFGGAMLDEYYWSADGQYLVCSYIQGQFAEHSLYMIDISSSKPKWQRLPITVYEGQWMVLEKLPSAACKP